MTPEDKTFDTEVIRNIKTYIKVNNLSMRKTAEAAGMKYERLWSILTRNQGLKLKDYAALCEAFQEPLDAFIPDEKTAC